MWCCGGKESGRSCDDGIKNRTGVDRPDRAVIVHLVQKCWKCQSSSNFQILDKLGLSLRIKKGFLGQKLGKKFSMKDFSGQKKQAGADLKKKKKIFLGQKLGIMSRN